MSESPSSNATVPSVNATLPNGYGLLVFGGGLLLILIVGAIFLAMVHSCETGTPCKKSVEQDHLNIEEG